MKIGYLMQAGAADMTAFPLSGPANHVKHVCQELVALGHSVEILLTLQGQLWHSADLRTYHPVHLPWLEGGPWRLGQGIMRRLQGSLGLPYAAFFEAFHFALACRQVLGNCDLFLERMGWMGYGGTLAAQWLNIPICLEVNGDHLDEMTMLGVAPQGAQKWISMQIMRWTTNHAAHVITTGDGWRQRFLERWPVAPAKVTAVENGSEVVDRLQRSDLRVFKPLAIEEAVKLVYVGGFESWHGILNLLYALAGAVAQGATVQLYLIGAGPEQAKIEATIQELDLDAQVTLTGFVDMQRLSSYLAEADIGLCPYCGRIEYSGLKLLDYKSAGLATIASGANGQPVVLQHGETGWLVPPCDIDALTAAILVLSRDHERRRQIGRAARIEAEREHSWRQTAKRLDALFQPLLPRAASLHQMDKLTHEA
ncbi:MAG: glycosyltransferase family 4 protein [Caldilineaceae bacterium]|nr:glycosyltransferase family 4 protein [Caldilineaceae bacterium]MCB0124120.1 glycosyltransferase family 4 protein [Caldilineaceae bacterium]